MNHQLHLKIGDFVSKNFKGVINDTACGGDHTLSLFFTQNPKSENKLCDVDILIIKDGKVKVLFEIEESGFIPTKICGKFLTSALSKYYIYNGQKIDMDDSVLFIQVLDTFKLEKGSRKIGQWNNLEQEIKKIIPVKDSKITDYKLYSYSLEDDFKEMIEYVTEFMK